MNSGLSFVLALAAWVVLSSVAAIAVGRVVREAERHVHDLHSIEQFERARRPFRNP